MSFNRLGTLEKRESDSENISENLFAEAWVQRPMDDVFVYTNNV